MVDLVARSACDGLLPLEIGDVRAAEESPLAITSMAPFRSASPTLSDHLQAAHGMAWPKPNRATGTAAARALWFGHAHALLIGPPADASLASHMALTDQTDAWAVVRLNGAAVPDVMARLCPVDLRFDMFRRGHTLRTELQHMSASVTRVGDRAVQVMVFRSMARTLVHDLKTAMEAVAARG